MYEYDPKLPKQRERILLFAFLFFAAILFAVSAMPGVAFPALYQLISVLLLVGVVMLVSRCMLRRFVYRVEPREGAQPQDPCDLVITEYYGNHASVVCRISVADIENITRLTHENSKEVSAMLRQQRVYHYTALLWSDQIYLLTVRDEDEVFYIRILADNTLLSVLKSHKQQEMS